MDRPGKLARTFLVVSVVLAFLMAAGSAVALGGDMWASNKLDAQGVEFDPQADTGVESPSPGPQTWDLGGKCEETCNYLVLGSDSRSGLTRQEQKDFQTDAQISGYRSDTMMLVSIDSVDRHATIVSFPRDLLVDIPGYGKDKINAAFSLGAADGRGVQGGATLAAKTVSQLTGMPIQHFMVVDLAGFEAIVDAVGTVPFCTPVGMKDDPQAFGEGPENGGSGLNLPHSGCYDLDGATALALVRARHVVYDDGAKDCVSDYARIARQQQFMRALMNKLLSPAMLPNLPDLVGVVTEQLTFDDQLKIPDLLDLSNAMQGVASGNADFRTVPNELGWATIGGLRASVLLVTPEGKLFLRRLASGQSLGDMGTELEGQPPAPAEIAVRVYDDASEGHAQNDVFKEQLSDSGFKMLATDAEPAPQQLQGIGTVILYNKGYEDHARVLAGYVPGVEVQPAQPGQLPGDTQVGVVVDETYKYKDPQSSKESTVEVDCPYG